MLNIIKDVDWTEDKHKENAKFLSDAINNINERINKLYENNNYVLASEIDKIVREELGLDLHQYDVDFMDMYINRSDED